jgi:hypothetical protein
LGCCVNCAQQAAAPEARFSRTRINPDITQRREIDDQPIITRAETGQTVPTATYCGYDVGSPDSSQTGLNIGFVSAARQQGRPAIKHSVPHRRRSTVIEIAGAKEGSLKIGANFAVDVFDVLVHQLFALESQVAVGTSADEIAPRSRDPV